MIANSNSLFCDVALPVPVDRLFTYGVPTSLQGRVQVGARIIVPFGSRKLVGIIVNVHRSPPDQQIRELISVRDSEPVLDAELLALGRWIAGYYCAPIGEVLKGMLPLSGETRRSVKYNLTSAGRDIARQLTVLDAPDTASRVLAVLSERARSAEYLNTKIPEAKASLRALLKRGWVEVEEEDQERDPLRARAERLRASFVARPLPGSLKLKKAEAGAACVPRVASRRSQSG